MAPGLPDVPLPPNIERPEMWTAAEIVQAVRDGFTFLIPFRRGKELFDPNAYWIGKDQYAASAFTVGPEHSPDIRLERHGANDWIVTTAYFRPEMVSEKNWLETPNQYGVVPVKLKIDPDTIDFNNLNRGHQIRIPKGFLGAARGNQSRRVTFLNSKEDMKWLRETALKAAARRFRNETYRSAVIQGNEDSPQVIELYRKRDPLVTDKPVILVYDPINDRYVE